MLGTQKDMLFGLFMGFAMGPFMLYWVWHDTSQTIRSKIGYSTLHIQNFAN